MAQPRALTSTQFRLRTLLGLMLAVAIFSWVVTIVPPPLWFILAFHVLPVVLLTACILGAIYLPGPWRAFCLGYAITLLQVVVLTFLLVRDFDYRFIMRTWQIMSLVPVLLIVLPGAMGLIGVFFQNIAHRVKQTEAALARAVAAKARQQAQHRPRPMIREVLEIRDEPDDPGAILFRETRATVPEGTGR
jgi:hypothetical protein